MEDRIVFFGTSEFSAPALTALLEAGSPVVAVITKPDSPAGRGRRLTAPLVKQIAQQHSLPVLQPERLDAEFMGQLATLQPTAGVVVAYGKILPKAVLEAFPKGLVNIHASLLPKHRGPSPIEAAILNGDDRTGVTLMRIEPSMDTGAIYRQAEIRLEGQETRPQLYDRLSRLGAELLARDLPRILSGELEPHTQDESRASVVKLIHKSDGIITPEKTVAQVEREIRAYLGWPGSRLGLFPDDATLSTLTITQARRTDDQVTAGKLSTQDGRLLIGLTDGTLEILKLKPAGKSEMNAGDWLRGHSLNP